jgi:hypothetical protein
MAVGDEQRDQCKHRAGKERNPAVKLEDQNPTQTEPSPLTA